jgi:hypothetical protein
MERGRSYTEEELGEKEYLEKEIKIIFFIDEISSTMVKICNRLLQKGKKLINWAREYCTFFNRRR